jgi:hypothetical protein
MSATLLNMAYFGIRQVVMRFWESHRDVDAAELLLAPLIRSLGIRDLQIPSDVDKNCQDETAATTASLGRV